MELDVDIAFGLLALAVAVYAMLAAAFSRASVTAALSFLVIGAFVGGAGLGLLVEELPDGSLLSLLAEVTLALVLFSAASTIRLKRLEADTALVARLLVVGLPLTIVAGTALAIGLFPGVSLGLALLIGTTLAPTDADLGHQVISDRSVPARVRRMLNVESGLNDGIAAPIVTVAIALAAVGDLSGMRPVVDALTELVLAAVIGIVVGGVGRWLLIRADLRQTTTPSSRQLATLALALGAYFIAAGLGSSGFIAAFAAGLAFGFGNKERVESAVSFTEAQSVLLSILVWLVFGLLVFGEHIVDLSNPTVIAYALLSLTAVRMIPVMVALAGTRLDPVTKAFVGWFGPRGLASVVFVLLAIEALDAAGVKTDPLGPVVAWTVILSVVAHGFSARWLASWYGRYAAGLPEDSPERVGDQEPHRRAAWTFHDRRGGAEPPPP